MVKPSSIDRIAGHLKRRGSRAPVPVELEDDLETLVRRCDEVRSLGRAYGSVELSPYLRSLLRVSGLEDRKAEVPLAATSAAAGG